MDDEADALDDGPDQWSPEARQVLLARADEVRTAVNHYVEALSTLEGRQAELPDLVDISDRLRSVAAAFDDAAFDLTGISPLGVDAWDDEEDEVEDEPDDASGPVLTVVGRWDYRVTDPDALMESGRRGYLAHWSDDTDEDAAFRVQDVVSAASEIIHGDAVHRLDETPGLEQVRFVTTLFTHDGEDDETFDDDPFAIARAPQEN
ncbi:hypothetical protein [Phycicoccus sp.]|uniref:hypothetical protein n=1 Tax=Phycicoccus sp. TaxID=1902410 RepID=UPI002BAAD843|nr:hypothetical protein [Phycicoccus sp.]HMM95107.1 hypothetical protein [Phycicoccus sp.]